MAAHRLWSNWLREGRVRKIAIVAEKVEETRTASGLERIVSHDHRRRCIRR
jgi:hypothetical protein